MTRIVAITLLLVILMDSFCDSKVYDQFQSAGFTTLEIRKCRCKHVTNRKLKCPFPLIPTNDPEEEELKNCLCSKKSEDSHHGIMTFCSFKWTPRSLGPL